jgi:DNA replication protein DnaC
MASWIDFLRGMAIPGLDTNVTEAEAEAAIERGRKSLAAMEAAEKLEAPYMAKALYTRLSRDDVKTKTFETFAATSAETLAAKARVQAWNPALHTFGLFLYGPPGTGKTHLMKAVLVRHASPDYPCAFESVSSIMDRIKATYDASENARHRVIEDLATPKLLALDDFGAERSTEWAQEQFLTLLERRMRAGRTVFMTSNLTREEIMARYQARIVDRLMEVFVFVKVDGPSHRRTIYAANAAALGGNIK